MSDVPVGTAVDAALRERLAALENNLQAPRTSNSTFAAIRSRRKASADVYQVAKDRPGAVYQLLPSLVESLQMELTREWPAADVLVYQSLSRDIQHYITETLAVMVRPDLVTSSRATGHSLEPVMEVLAETLVESTVRDSQHAALRGLGTLCNAIPEEVATVVSVPRVAPAVGHLITMATSNRHLRAGAQLLLVLSQEMPAKGIETSAVQKGIAKLADCDDPQCRIYSGLLTERSRHHTNRSDNAWADSPTVATLLEDAHTADTTDTKRARQLGLLVSLVPSVVPEPSWRLIVRVRTTVGGDRWRAAEALGVVTAKTRSSESWVDTYVSSIANTTGSTRRTVASIIGEIASAYPDWFEDVPASFVQGLSKHTPPTDDALCALGDCIAIGANSNTATREAIHTQIETSTGEQRYQALIALGEWVGHAPATVEGVPPNLVEELHQTADDQRQSVALALGVIAHDTAAWRICIESTQNQSSEHWRCMARGLGELAVSTPVGGYFTDIPLDRLESSSGKERQWLMQAVGVGIAHATRAHERLRDAIQAWVCTSTVIPYEDRVRFFGEWIVSVPSEVSFDTTPLIDRIHASDGRDRTRAVRTVGEVALATATCCHPPLKALLSRLQRTVEIRRIAASSLRSTIEPLVDASDIELASLEAITTIDTDPEWVLEAIGEFAAVAPADSVAHPEDLSNEVRRSTHWDRQQAARALGVGIAVINNTISDPLVSLVCHRVPFVKNRQTADYILGEVAAAAPEVCPAVPPVLVTQIRSADGEARRRLAQATGVGLSAAPSEAEFSLPQLRKSIASATGKRRRQKVRALGELAQALPERFEMSQQTSPAMFVPSTPQAPGEHAEAIGEVLLTDTVDEAVKGLMARFRNESIFERKRRTEMLRTLASLGVIEPEQLLRAIAASTPGVQPDATLLDLVLAFREPNRTTLLEAISAAVIHTDTHCNPELRVQIQTLLEGSHEIEPASRLMAVDILSSLDSALLSDTPN